MVRPFFIIILLVFSTVVKAQEPDSSRTTQKLKLTSASLISSGRELPFWWKNQNSGRFQENSSNQIFTQVNYYGNYQVTENAKLYWDSEFVLNLNNRVNVGIIQGNLGLLTNRYNIKIGMDEEFVGSYNHSLSIGNLVNNVNALPIPKISLSTNGWQPSPVFGKVLFYKALLSHGWFEKARVQSGAFLHQKYFYTQGRLIQSKLKLSLGLIHNAQWGGKNLDSEVVQPTGLKNYARIFLGSAGGSDALTTDQLNVLGNHVGTYDLSASYDFGSFELKNYWQFLWEDRSGLVPLNWRDGLVGVEVKVKSSSFIESAVFEIVRTNSQDADRSITDGVLRIAPDDFLNNSVYQSGWTYQQSVIGSPLFLRQRLEAGGYSPIFNMINAWNLGLSGQIGKYHYNLKLIDFKNSGRRLDRLQEPFELFSADLLIAVPLTTEITMEYRLNYQDGNIVGGKNIALGVSFGYSFFNQ